MCHKFLQGRIKLFFSSADRVPPKALAVAQAEREGGLNHKTKMGNHSYELLPIFTL